MARVPLAMIVFVLAAAPAAARTWTVGGRDADFPFISPAIRAAAAGDVIRVRPGVYREDLVIDKRLAIVGEGRPTLIGSGLGTVVVIAAARCELTGFVIEGSGTGETNAMDAAVQVGSNDNRVAGNWIRRTFYGVVVVDGARNQIVENEILGLRHLPFGQRGDGIYVLRAPDTLVERNRVSGERDGIYFQYAARGRALDNAVSDSRYGLHDMFSDEAVVSGNVFADSAVGANIMNSRRIVFERNRVSRNRGIPGVGLALKDCDDSSVTGNTIAANSRGLLVDGSSRNVFSANSFAANDTAVSLFSSAEANRFGGNRFVDNWSDLVLNGRGSNTEWSIDGRGNYWSRYDGYDFDGDGIGDRPHAALGAFEQLEGINPATRIFLHSPAAAGLELAWRMSGLTPSDAVDARPLVYVGADLQVGPRQAGPKARPYAILALAGVVALIARRSSSCSR